jgi:hypothetical protein
VPAVAVSEQEEIRKLHFVPQAILKEPPNFFEARDVKFHEGHDGSR